MLERFDLDPTKKGPHLLEGQTARRVALVAALASPGSAAAARRADQRGLDPIMETAFTEFIREVKAQGRSVLLSATSFAEVEKLADRWRSSVRV